ncbi:PREDICTED: uncharacterized protein LOC107174152 [Diuraphis noxia]|uniref:uncharacterized protein LOC107174152 n=1 Tax=Diuraphis noxia TaxID=143948 RepID=UPI000763A651|nr:PREDICTED: uncharacterized protein LOC107174152 [Diuraphis noxia]
MGSSNLAAVAGYLMLWLFIASAAADVGDDYDDYSYSDFFPELSIQPSGLDTTDADPDEKHHEFRFVDYKSVPDELATVRDDDGLIFRSKALPPSIIRQRTNISRADRGLRQTTVIKKRGGVPWAWHASDFDMESDGVIPVVNHIRESTTERSTSTSLVTASNRVFDFSWNDLIKKTNKIPQQSITDGYYSL